MKHTLASIPLGREVEICEILLDAPMRERLFDLGLTPGCRVRCI